MSGASDIFRQPWKPFKLAEEEGDLPLGYAEHVRGRIVRPGRVRLRPAPARRQTAPTNGRWGSIITGAGRVTAFT